MTPKAAWLTTVTLATAILTYSLAVTGSEIVLLTLPVMVAVRYFAFTREEQITPQWFVAFCTFLAVVYAGYRVLKLGAEIEVLAEFVALIAVIKSMERWSARDDMQMLIIAIFLVLAASISSSTLAIGVMLLIFVPLLGYTAMRLQIEGAITFGGEDKLETKPTRSADKNPLMGTFITALLLVSGISIVAFVLLPRGLGDNTLGGFSRPAMGRATGFRNSVELGRGGLISNDETVVMEVQVRDRYTDSSLGALGKVYHLRGNALTKYEDRRWTSTLDDGSSNDVRPQPVRHGFTFQGASSEASLKQIIKLTPNASDSGILFSIWQPSRVDFPTMQESTVTVDTKQLTMRLGSSRSQLTTYEVVSNKSPRRLRGSRGRTLDPYFLNNEVIRGIAEGVLVSEEIEPNPELRFQNGDSEAAEAIETWLAETGGFTYTLDIQDAAADIDPIEWFLTEAKTGHCEYYASAMVGLCRSVGINARVVTGYVMAEYDTVKESYIVRRSNAHAWVEAETSRGRWETFDPTPDVIALHAPEESQLRFLRKFLDAIDGFWLSSVVSFSETNQMKLFGLDERDLSSSGRSSVSGSESVRIFRIVFSVGLSALAGFMVYRWYRKPRLDSDQARVVELPKAALEIRQKLLSHWKDSGRERPEWVGLVAHAEGARETELASMLCAAAFGSTDWADRHTARSHELLAQIAESEPN